MGQEKTPQTQEEFLDFELEIDMGSDRTYPIAVLGSPAGEAHEQMHFPYDKVTLDIQLLTLQNALLRSGAAGSQVLLPEEQQVQDFGHALFTTLFTGEVGNLYAASRDRAAQQSKGLRLKLHILAPELASLPWEYLYDPAHAEYLCLSRYTPVIRYLELPQPPQPLSVVLPLRILGMIAAPTNLPALDSTGEQQRIEKALEPLQQRGLVQLTWLAGQTWQAVQQAMSQGPWHIFHFIGHGSFDALADEGVIAFADEAGQAQLLRATQLGTLLADQRPLRFVVLNACQGAEGSRQDVFSSTASILVRAGLPAVLAMQYSITDSAAIAFSRAFYAALAEGLPVDAAVSEARKAVSLGGGDTLEWGIPVLFMRSPDGVLFTIDRSVTPPPAQPPPPVTPPPAQPLPPVTPPQVTAAGSLLSRRNLLIGLASLVAVGGGLTGVTLASKPARGTLFHTFPQGDIVYALAWSPDGTHLAAASNAQGVQVWDTTNGSYVLHYTGHAPGIASAVAWSPDGKYIASGGSDATVQVWEALTKRKIFTIQTGHIGSFVNNKAVNAVAWSPDGKYLASAGQEGDVKVWDAGTGRPKYTYTGHISQFGSSVNAVAWSPDGTRIASASSDNTVQVWDATTGHHVFPYPGHASDVLAVAWSPDGMRIASGSADQTVQVWNPSPSAGETLHYSGHSDSVEAVAWSSDGQHLASGSVDKTVRVWDLSSTVNLYIYRGHTDEVYTVAWSPGGFPWPWSHEGQRFASGGKDTTVRLWQAV